MDVFGMLTQVVNFVVKIKSAMKDAGSNAEDCDTIEDVLGILSVIAKQLQEEPGTLRDATNLLGRAMSCASELVHKCKDKRYLRRLCEAGDIFKDLDRLRSNIQLILQTVNTAATVQLRADVVQLRADNVQFHTANAYNKSMLVKIVHLLEDNRDVHQQKEVKELVLPQRHSTDQCATSQSKKNEDKKKPKKTQVASWPQDKILENNRLGDSKQALQPSLSAKASSSVSKLVVNKAQSVAVSAAPFQVILRSTENMTVVRSIDVHPIEKWIVTGHEGGYISMWDYQKQKCVKEVKVNEVPDKKPSGFVQLFKGKAPEYWVCSTKFIVKEKWLAVGDARGYIHIYDYTATDTELREVKKIETHHRYVDTLCVHPTEPYLLSSCAYGNKIKLWHWSRNDWKEIREFDVKSKIYKGVLSLKFNPRDTNTFACVTDDGRVMVWDINSSSSLTTIELKNTKILKADYFFTHSQQHLMVTRSMSGSALPNCEIRDLATGKVVHTLGVDGRKMKRVAGHPMLPELVSASDDGTICYWDARTKGIVKMDQIPDTEPDDLALVTDTNGLTRLVANFKTTVAIMEINFI